MSSIVVLGYGNPLRRDDGIGWRVAEAVADRWKGNLTVRTAQQLVPEWATDLAEADVAFIVDACVASRRVRLRRLIRRANKPALLDGHAFAPAELIGLAHMVYGRCAPTYLVHVPAKDSPTAPHCRPAQLPVFDKPFNCSMAGWHTYSYEEIS